MIISGNSEDFESNIANVGLVPDDPATLKKFIQKVEDMNL